MRLSGHYSAVIPAAGKGSRLGPLDFSKELLPIGFEKLPGQARSPKPIASYLIDSFRKAGIQDIHIVLRKGKEDIIKCFQSGESRGVRFSYYKTESDAGVPVTLDEAYQHTKNNNIVFGFPDILFKPGNAIKEMADHLEKDTGTDLLLGLFPVEDPEIWDTVEMDHSGTIRHIWIKERNASLNPFAWIMAAWKPTFSEFMHQEVMKILAGESGIKKELYMGVMIRRAIEAGLVVKGIPFYDGQCLDVGTPNGHAKAEMFIKEI